jgi:hypothetical protein
MDYSTYYLLWIGLCAVPIVIGVGLWTVKSVGGQAKTQRRATLPVAREHDMRRDGLSLD